MKLSAEYTMADLLKLAITDLEAAGYVATETDSGATAEEEVVFIFTVAPVEKTAPPQTPEVATPEPAPKKRGGTKGRKLNLTDEQRAARALNFQNRKKKIEPVEEQAEPAEQITPEILLDTVEVVAAASSPF